MTYLLKTATTPAEPYEQIASRYMSNADAVIMLTAPQAPGTYKLHYINRDNRLLNTKTFKAVK